MSGNDRLLLGISVISICEFLCFPRIRTGDIQTFRQFVARVDVVDLTACNYALIDKACEIRSRCKLRLPDAIVAASAHVNNATIVTADRHLLKPGIPAAMSLP